MKVVVVGGGVIGLAIAWRAAGQGLEVAVIDPGTGRGAWRVAAGMLAPVTEVHYGEEAILGLNLESARRYPAFVDELERASGCTTGYRPSGTLTVARHADDLEAVEELVAYQRGLGLAAERLRSRELRRLEPALAPGVRGGALVPGDHQVDPRRLVAALAEGCRRRGVHQRRGQVRGLGPGGVELDGGENCRADAVVVAAGCWSGALDGGANGVEPSVRPVKGQILRLRCSATMPPPLAQHNIRGLDAYLVCRQDGEVVVGATVEERGFDTTVTGGGVHDLLRAAVELIPDVGELELVETAAGLRPATPDNAPIIGPSPIEGVVLATGHYRNGILLAPVTADCVAELLASGKVPAVIAPFAPGRFDRSDPVAS